MRLPFRWARRRRPAPPRFNDPVPPSGWVAQGPHLHDEDGATQTAWRPERRPTPQELADTVKLRKDDPMPDITDHNPADTAAGQTLTTDAVAAARTGQGGRLVDLPDPPPPAREVCDYCHGTGYALTKNDLLRASLDLLGDDPRELDHFVAEFYRRLLNAAPALAPLFPDDLRDERSSPNGRGKAQRDKLLNALVALGQAYDPDNREQMQALDTHLAAFGRSHAAFARPDGSVRGATLEEYAAVKATLFGLLHDAVERWEADFDDVWSEAYDYAAAAMMRAAHLSGMRAARQPRPAR